MSSQPPPPFGDDAPSGGPPPPSPGWGGGQSPWGQPQAGGPAESAGGPPPSFGTPPPGAGGPPPGVGGPPPGFGGPPPGFGGPPPGFGGPPPGFGGPPPGFGGPPGVGQTPPGGGSSSSTAVALVVIAVAVLVVGAGIAAFLLLTGDDPEGDPPETVVATTAPESTSRPSPASPAAEPAPADPAPAPPPGVPEGRGIRIGETISGEITAALPSQDLFFEGVAGSRVEITMNAVDGDLDPLLRLFGPDGEQIAEADDIDFPDDRDARITTILIEDGQYRIEATSFSNASFGRFEVTLAARSALTAQDTLSEARPEISYEYEGAAGTTIVIDMVGTDDRIDPLLRLIAPDGSTVADDDDGGEGRDARIEYTITETGTYTVVASTFSSTFGSFALSIVEE